MWYLIRLIRLSHLLAFILIFLTVRYAIVRPWLEEYHFSEPLSLIRFSLLLLGGLLLACGAILVNDYFDWHDDRIARPEKVIVGRHISRRTIILLHGLLTTLGTLLLCSVAFLFNNFYLVLLFPFIARLLWYYSKVYKQRFVIGTPLHFLFLFSIPLLPLLFEFYAINTYLWQSLSVNSISVLDFLIEGLIYALFVALIGMTLAFEKQIISYAKQTNLRTETLPEKFGIVNAKIVVVVLKSILILLALLITGFSTITTKEKNNFALLLSSYTLLFIILPLVFSAIISYSNKNNTAKFARSLTTLVAIFGLLFPWLSIVLTSFQ